MHKPQDARCPLTPTRLAEHFIQRQVTSLDFKYMLLT